MLRSAFALIAVAALALPATELSAQDTEEVYDALVGEWERMVEIPGGGNFTETFVFTVEDDVLTGISSTEYGDTELDEVSFEDGTLTFEVARNFEGQSFTQSFTATVEEDEMTGTVDGGPGGNQEFTATRSTD